MWAPPAAANPPGAQGGGWSQRGAPITTVNTPLSRSGRALTSSQQQAPLRAVGQRLPRQLLQGEGGPATCRDRAGVTGHGRDGPAAPGSGQGQPGGCPYLPGRCRCPSRRRETGRPRTAAAPAGTRQRGALRPSPARRPRPPPRPRAPQAPQAVPRGAHRVLGGHIILHPPHAQVHHGGPTGPWPLPPPRSPAPPTARPFHRPFRRGPGGTGWAFSPAPGRAGPIFLCYCGHAEAV